jgi:hypothetical protein
LAGSLVASLVGSLGGTFGCTHRVASLGGTRSIGCLAGSLVGSLGGTFGCTDRVASLAASAAPAASAAWPTASSAASPRRFLLMARLAERVVLVVCGFAEHGRAIAKCRGWGFKEVDVAAMLPRDPGRRGGKGDHPDLVDDVVGQQGFAEAVAAVVAAAPNHVVVKCRAGKHRSPVVGAESGEVQG